MLLMIMALTEDPLDRLGIEDIYNKYHRQMLFVARQVLNQAEDAEDAVQDAMERIARNITALHDQSDWAIRGYVLTAAKNAALNLNRKKRRNVHSIENLAIKMELEDITFEEVKKMADYQQLLTALQQMDLKYRQVLMLVYVQEMTVAEAADVLCRNESTVRKQLCRAKRLLANMCKEG